MRHKTFSIALLLCLTACSSATPIASSLPTANRQPPTATPAPTLPAPTTVVITPAEGPTQYGPDNFPSDVNPLTGLKVADVSVLERRPLAVKVSEFPRAVR